jgi:hypothetical protein
MLYTNSVCEVDNHLSKQFKLMRPVRNVVVLGQPLSLDFLALLRVRRLHSDIKTTISFTSTPARLFASSFVDRLLKNLDSGRWGNFVFKRAQAITITVVRNKPHLEITVRTIGKKPWMPFHGTTQAQQIDATVLEWLMAIGLGEFNLQLHMVDII